MVGTMALNPPRALHEAVQRDLAALAEWAGTRGWTVLFSPHERNPLAPPPPRRDTARSGSVGDTASHHRGPGRARPQANGCPRAGRKRRALPVTLRLARCVARLRPRGFSLNPYRPGDFVWSHYPLSENPARPGPRHIGYVTLSTSSDTEDLVWLAFTTSQPWTGRKPSGVYSVDRDAAAGMGQSRPFTLDLRRMANVPVTAAWFPDLSAPAHGIVGRAPERLRLVYEAALIALARRHPDTIERLGPLVPRPRR